MQYYSIENMKNPDISVYAREGCRVSVTAGKTAVLKVGAPFTAQVSRPRTEGRDQMYLSLDFKDCGGHECTVGAPSTPRFQILSQSGKVLQEGAFTYG